MPTRITTSLIRVSRAREQARSSVDLPPMPNGDYLHDTASVIHQIKDSVGPDADTILASSFELDAPVGARLGFE
jgi:hypothetical protein